MYDYLFAWMPPVLAILCMLYIGILVIYIVLRLVALVLSAIPFL